MNGDNMKATLTIDFNDWIGGEDESGNVGEWLLNEVRMSLPKLFSETKQKEIRAIVQSHFEGQTYKAIDAEISAQFGRLMNEELVVTDNWGKKEFYGSVEDYIKKSIDQRLFAPVDSQGKKVTSCSSSQQTWLEWYVRNNLERSIETRLKEQIQGSVNKLSAVMDKEIKERLENEVNGKLADKIIKAMKNLGIEPKG